MYMCVYIYIYICVYMCVCVYIYIYIHVIHNVSHARHRRRTYPAAQDVEELGDALVHRVGLLLIVGVLI